MDNLHQPQWVALARRPGSPRTAQGALQSVEALEDKEIHACIPGRKQHKTTVKHDKRRYKRRNRIEIMFGSLKDWRRVATRDDRRAKVFLLAIALAAAIIFWFSTLVRP